MCNYLLSQLIHEYVYYVFRLFTEILTKAHDSNDIQFAASGQWSPIVQKEEKSKSADTSVYETIPGISYGAFGTEISAILGTVFVQIFLEGCFCRVFIW
jgi:hypothetical protein